MVSYECCAIVCPSNDPNLVDECRQLKAVDTGKACHGRPGSQWTRRTNLAIFVVVSLLVSTDYLAFRANYAWLPGVVASKYPMNPGPIGTHRSFASISSRKTGSTSFVHGSSFAVSSDEADTRRIHKAPTSFRRTRRLRNTLSTKSVFSSATSQREITLGAEISTPVAAPAGANYSPPVLSRGSSRAHFATAAAATCRGDGDDGRGNVIAKNQAPVLPHPSEDQLIGSNRREDDVRMLDIMKFGASTLAIWSFNPLMSLIDTAVIAWSGDRGLPSSLGGEWPMRMRMMMRRMLRGEGNGGAAFSSSSPLLLSVQLAAMGPATVTCDVAVYLFSFIGVYATTQLASAIAAAKAEARAAYIETTRGSAAGSCDTSALVIRMARRRSEISRIRSEALTVALLCGLGILLFTELLGPLLIRVSQPAAVVPHASAYVAARGLALPFAVVAAVAQALCLGARDVYTPVLSTAVACVLNVVGDIVLIWGFKMGCLGAAIATAVAEAVACVVLLKSISASQRETRSGMPLDLEDKVGQKCAAPGLDILGPRGLFVRMAPRDVVAYLLTAAPVFLALCGRTLSQAVVAYFVAHCDTAGMAAHQVLLRIRLLFAVFGDAFSQTALSLLPYAANGPPVAVSASKAEIGVTRAESTESATPPPSVPVASALRQFAARFVVFAGTVASMVGAGALLMAIKLNRLFTPDGALRSLISAVPVAVLLGGTVALHGLSMALEGALMALDELPFVSFMSITNVVSVAVILQVIVRRADPVCALPLRVVWQAAAGLEAALALQYGLRLLWRLYA